MQWSRVKREYLKELFALTIFVLFLPFGLGSTVFHHSALVEVTNDLHICHIQWSILCPHLWFIIIICHSWSLPPSYSLFKVASGTHLSVEIRISWFTYSFGKYLLSTYYLPETILSTRDVVLNQTDEIPNPHGIYIYWEETENKLSKFYIYV